MPDSVSLAQLEIVPSSGTGRPNSALEGSGGTTCDSSNGCDSVDGQQTAQLAKDTAEVHADLARERHARSPLARSFGGPGRTDNGPTTPHLDYLHLHDV